MFSTFNLELSPVANEDTGRRRKYRPKTKSGCKTCKSRRVKCDETKPACLRCIKFGVSCDGYGDTPLRFYEEKSSSPDEVSVARSVPKTPSSGFHLRNDVEFQYLELFRKEIAAELAGGFDPVMWNRQILQACSFPPVLHLTLATAALKKSGRNRRTDVVARDQYHHYEYALKLYASAVQEVRTCFQQNHPSSLRIALVAALLIFCFENMLGDTMRAVLSIQSALELMHKQLAPKRRTNSDNPWSRASSQIEKQMLTTFMRFDRPTVTVLGRNKSSLSLSTNRRLEANLHFEQYTIPERFTSVVEARDIFDQIRQRALPKYNPENVWGSTFTPPDHEVPSADNLRKVLHTFARPPPPSGASANLRKDFASWYRAFNPLYAECLTPDRASDYVAAATIQVQALSVIHAFHKFSEMAASSAAYGMGPSAIKTPPDSPTNPSVICARQLLDLCHSIVAHPTFTKTFVCDIMIIPSLWIVITACQVLSMRKEAIEILKEIRPRVECIWSADTVAKAGEKIVKILEAEERGEYYQDPEERDVSPGSMVYGEAFYTTPPAMVQSEGTYNTTSPPGSDGVSASTASPGSDQVYGKAIPERPHY